MSTTLEKIKSGEAHMRPKWHFVAMSIGLVAAGMFLFLLILLLMGFSFFIFGLVGLLALELFARHYAIAYRRPLLISLLVLVILLLAGHVILRRLRFHEEVSRRVHHRLEIRHLRRL